MITPSQMASITLQVMSVLNTSPVVLQLIAEAKGMLTCEPGYDRPMTSALQAVRAYQGVPAQPGSEGLLVSETRFIRPHYAAAQLVGHPMAEVLYEARHDLLGAVRYGAAYIGAAPVMMGDRDQRVSWTESAKARLEGVDAQLRALQPETVRGVLQPGSSIALWHVFVQAMGWPDGHFVTQLCTGFPCIGDYPDSGVFRASEEPAEKVYDELDHDSHNRAVANCLRRQGADPRMDHILERVTAKTRSEVVKGVAKGPLTMTGVIRELGTGVVRVLHRFGVEQGVEEDGVTPKVRPCDNAKTSLTNKCLGTHETISCEQPTFPVLTAALYGAACREAGLPFCPMQHSTDDVELAYRRMAAAHPEVTVVAIWDTDLKDVAYYTMKGHNFGLKAAVLSFNRHSQLIVAVARRFFGVACGAYFDDYDVTEPVQFGRSGKRILHFLHKKLGVPLAGGTKDVDPAAANAFLGVVVDLRNAHEGVAYIRSKVSRVAGMIATMETCAETGTVTYGTLRTLVGKLEYTSGSAVNGRLGRAALSTIRSLLKQRRAMPNSARSDEASLVLTPLVLAALAFYVQVLPLLRARKFHLERRVVRPPVIVYTDAMYAANAAVPARIGIVIYDPEDPETRHWVPSSPGGSSGEWVCSPTWRHSSLIISPELLSQFDAREQYVGQLEVLAAVATYTSRPEQLRDRDVIHYIDNTGAMNGITKGYSRDDDSARLIHVCHAMMSAIGVNVWFEYVASGANIADLPSRGEFELLHELGSIEFEIITPVIKADWLEAYRVAYDRYAPKRTGAEKRTARAIEVEVSRMRSERRRKRARTE